jgi:hypothetical protein
MAASQRSARSKRTHWRLEFPRLAWVTAEIFKHRIDFNQSDVVAGSFAVGSFHFVNRTLFVAKARHISAKLGRRGSPYNESPKSMSWRL